MRTMKHPYYISEIEYEAAKKWIDEVAQPAAIAKQRSSTRLPARHVSACWAGGYAYDEQVRYIITPTSVGPLVDVEFRARGVKPMVHSITDFSTW